MNFWFGAYFWGSIPTRRYVIGVGRTRPDLSGQTEISNFDQIWSGAQQILGLQVTMEETVSMHERQSADNLINRCDSTLQYS